MKVSERIGGLSADLGDQALVAGAEPVGGGVAAVEVFEDEERAAATG